MITTMGLPVEVIGLVTGIYRIIDQIHTATNSTGDLVVAACVASTEGTLDRNAPAYVSDKKECGLMDGKVKQIAAEAKE